jgi:hypothetical protein
VIEPSRIDELGLARDTLEVKPEAGNHGKASMIGSSRGASDPVYAGPNEGELETGLCGLSHIPIAAGIAIEPIS